MVNPMKKIWLILLLTSTAWGAYSPGVFVADPTTPTQRAAVSAGGALKVDNSGVTQPVSAASLPLPTGAATSALQSTISGQLPASLGQKAMAASLACTLASDQSAIPVTGTFWQATQPVSIAAAIPTKAPVNSAGSFSQTSVSTATTITAPANAVAFLIQGDSANTDCIRWEVGGTPTASVGFVAQPGQDSGEVHGGANISVIACSGTQLANVQWITQ